MDAFLGLIGFLGIVAVIYFIAKRSSEKKRGAGGEFPRDVDRKYREK